MTLVWGKPRTHAGKPIVVLMNATETQRDILFSHDLVDRIGETPGRAGVVIWLNESAVKQYGVERLVALLDEEIDEGAWLDWRWNYAINCALHFSGEQ